LGERKHVPKVFHASLGRTGECDHNRDPRRVRKRSKDGSTLLCVFKVNVESDTLAGLTWRAPRAPRNPGARPMKKGVAVGAQRLEIRRIVVRVIEIEVMDLKLARVMGVEDTSLA